MKRSMQVGLALCLGCTGTLSAAPSSQVAWTPETLKFIASGDPANGQKRSEQCTGCHGGEGVSQNPEWSNLAGQGMFYLYKQMQDYKQGTRQNPTMNAIMAGWDNQAIADLAAFYASLPSVETQAGESPSEMAEVLAKRGGNGRFIPACDSCHGSGGQGGQYDIPALAGQKPEYFRLTLLAFKHGSRANDIYSRMRLIAQQLSDEEIAQLAHYYGARGAQ